MSHNQCASPQLVYVNCSHRLLTDFIVLWTASLTLQVDEPVIRAHATLARLLDVALSPDWERPPNKPALEAILSLRLLSCHSILA
jgi:hypothetical protein